jgi:DNA topoisomerase-1
LWAKVKRGLSAGRVQSVALRIISDRDAEINEFISKEYWTLSADFYMEGEKKPLSAEFYGTTSQKLTIESEKDMDEIIKKLKKEKFIVSDVKKTERHKKSPLPFTTSTLQQEAAKTLNFSTQKTMRLAQSLYEGVAVKGHGTIGLITYLRTDSTRISEEAKAAAKEYITQNYGQDYLAGKTTVKQDGKKIQDAHEAIRPSYIDLTPASVKESLNRDQFRLYQLIWKRFMASQMAGATYETTSVKIDGGEYRFTASSSKVVFQGYLSVYQTDEDKVDKKTLSKNIVSGAEMKAEDLEKKQHFTQPPAHFTEASLVKTLEELGIGRPSTYAPTISTIINRHYVAKEQKQLYVTELGEVVNDIMKKSFPSIVDVNFTAALEGLLDRVEDGSVRWKTVIENFYPDLEEAVQKAQKELEEVTIEDEVTDVVCEECGRNLVVKYGPHGKFLACPGFPDCRNTKPFFEKIGVECPKCGSDLVMKMSRKGRRYFGCMSFPDCDFMTWQKPSPKKCPTCGGIMLEKGSKLVCMDEQCGYVEMKPKE